VLLYVFCCVLIVVFMVGIVMLIWGMVMFMGGGVMLILGGGGIVMFGSWMYGYWVCDPVTTGVPGAGMFGVVGVYVIVTLPTM